MATRPCGYPRHSGHGGIVMRLIAFRQHGAMTRIGALLDDSVIDVGELGYPSTMEDWFAAPSEALTRLRSDLSSATLPTLDVSHLWLQTPIPTPSKIIA